MIEELLSIQQNDSFPEMCARMGAFLGKNGPVPENALRRAIADPDYANNLIMCRNAPEFLDVLLQDPQNAAYEVEETKSEIGNSDLLRNAANAFVRWGKAGFSTVDDVTLERRENACLSCEHLQKPEKMLQKLVTSKSEEQLGKRAADCVCNLCGCVISKKIRLPTESCPGKNPDNPQLNKWGEPLKIV